MYEVEFTVNSETIGRLFQRARLATDDIDFNLINGQVFNCIGEAPPTSMGFNPSYDQGARGPTPRVSGFQPIRFTLTFPAYVIQGDGTAARYFLNDNAIRFFERLAKLNARRGDLQPEATIGLRVRRLLEENEPSDENATDATQLYSAYVDYERIVVFEAGGNQTQYVVGVDALTRPTETKVENYGAEQGG